MSDVSWFGNIHMLKRMVYLSGPCEVRLMMYYVPLLPCLSGSLLTLRRLMSYIYMEYPFLMFLDHTQRRSTVGRTPLDE